MDSRGGPEKVRRERLVCQAREVYIESKEDWISRCSHKTQWNRDRKRESGQGAKLAKAKKCKRCQEIFRPRKLLQEVY